MVSQTCWAAAAAEIFSSAGTRPMPPLETSAIFSMLSAFVRE